MNQTEKTAVANHIRANYKHEMHVPGNLVVWKMTSKKNVAVKDIPPASLPYYDVRGWRVINIEHKEKAPKPGMITAPTKPVMISGGKNPLKQFFHKVLSIFS